MSTRRNTGNGRRHPPLTARTLDARRDTPDLRDLLYTPALVEVPPEVPLETYRRWDVPVLDQGRQGACTGYGLATVVHYLLRRRQSRPALDVVSPHMLYRMARRYDEWPGEAYSGSSPRGAMKGWHRHGVCALALWQRPGQGRAAALLTRERALDALERPLGAYFRVNHKDLVAMHAALVEVGVLYASATCHDGWDKVGRDGRIPFERGDSGGHAFAIVAFDRAGFWIQNSWGEGWGREGFCHILYEDWLENGTDVWVARLGAPVAAEAVWTVQGEKTAGRRTVKRPGELVEIRPHVIGLGNEGELRPGGILDTDRAAVEHLFGAGGAFETITRDWSHRRLLLYAHGGLNDEQGALQRVKSYLPELLAREIYPVAFVWKTDYWTTLLNALEDARRKRRPEGFLDEAGEFMHNRLDDALEPLARCATGKLEWDEMKENALAASRNGGGAWLAARAIAALVARDPKVEVHVAGHSAGSILHAPLVRRMTEELGLTLASVTLWAPACTIELFRKSYEPAIRKNRIRDFGLFTLTDKAEQDDDCGGIYRKSLLYLVSHAFEQRLRIPGMGERFAGEPILGMERWLKRDPRMTALLARPNCSWVLTPNTEPEGSARASTAQHHGAFDDDRATLLATAARVLGCGPRGRVGRKGGGVRRRSKILTSPVRRRP